MKRMFLFFLPVLIFCCGASPDKVAEELSGIARQIHVSRSVQDQLEHQAYIVEYAVAHEQLTPQEQKKIHASLQEVERLHAKMKKNGSITKQEAKRLQQLLNRTYRMIWFQRINQKGKALQLSILGKKLRLKSEYRKKADRGSLSQEEMQKIINTYYRAHRLRDEMRAANLPKSQQQTLERQCFIILSEYFVAE